jgi:hypothetical protein
LFKNCDFIIKVLFVFSGLGKNQETSEIFTSLTSFGFDQLVADLPLCNTSIVFFHIGPAHSKPFHLNPSFSQLVFQAHAIVV